MMILTLIIAFVIILITNYLVYNEIKLALLASVILLEIMVILAITVAVIIS